MENLYNWIFWYNEFEKKWYAIQKNEYIQFFNGIDRDKTNYYISNEINELIEIIKK